MVTFRIHDFSHFQVCDMLLIIAVTIDFFNLFFLPETIHPNQCPLPLTCLLFHLACQLYIHQEGHYIQVL